MNPRFVKALSKRVSVPISSTWEKLALRFLITLLGFISLLSTSSSAMDLQTFFAEWREVRDAPKGTFTDFVIEYRTDLANFSTTAFRPTQQAFLRKHGGLKPTEEASKVYAGEGHLKRLLLLLKDKDFDPELEPFIRLALMDPSQKFFIHIEHRPNPLQLPFHIRFEASNRWYLKSEGRDIEIAFLNLVDNIEKHALKPYQKLNDHKLRPTPLVEK